MKTTMKRHNMILAGVLVVQAILSVIVFWPRQAATGQGGALFPGVTTSDIVALTIEDEKGNSISLSRAGGEEWVLSSGGDYPALGDKVLPLLEKIAALTTDRLVTRTDTSHKRLQVAADDFMRRVDLETADGTQYTLYLGSSPSYGSTHVRLEGEDETYLGKDISSWEMNATAGSWINTTYLQVERDSVTNMTLENANGTFVFTKSVNDAGESHWAMEGLAEDEILNEETVNTLLQRATSVNMATPLGQEEKATYGMADPSAIVTLEADGKTITLRVGAQDTPSASGGPTYVVKSSESSYYAQVSEFAVQHMVERARADFIQEPSEAAPEEERSDTE